MDLSPALPTYFKDHLAGARFALSLFDDLVKYSAMEEAALLRELQAEIVLDHSILTGMLLASDENESLSHQIVGRIGEKSARLKLNLTISFGRFEAVERLSLGIFGKLALWKTIEALTAQDPVLGQVLVGDVIPRTRFQHARLERLRITLAQGAFLQ